MTFTLRSILTLCDLCALCGKKSWKLTPTILRLTS
jgi:hypothetical protein